MSTFATDRLKQLVSYAIKGAGFNKLLELSTYMGIRVDSGILYLNTTDGTNYLSVSDACVADDMDITVDADLFSKLIGKINSDTVDMEVVNNTLVVTGKGKYTLELIPDENGGLFSFPNKFPDETETICTIGASDLLAISTSVKASLSSVPGSAYSSYYFGNIIASTDKAMMTIFNKKFCNEPYLLNRDFVDLMCMGNVDAEISKSDNLIMANASISEKGMISICTPIQAGVSDFNIDGVNKFAALKINSFCRIRKAELLDLLDRMILFVSKFDDGVIQLEFGNTGVSVSSLASNGVEFVEYQECKNVEPTTIKINIDRLRNQLKAYSSDLVDLYFGNDICIKFVDGDITQIIALIK